jgi:hypothetical protein
MDLKTTLRDCVNPGGLCVSATYILVVVFVFALTGLTTKPSNVGLDWIPFFVLAMPWSFLSQRLLLPGLILNAGLMYLLGALFHTLWRCVTRQSSDAAVKTRLK